MTKAPDHSAPQGTAEQHRSSLRRLGRDTLLYGFAMVLSRLVAFIMLPIYTRYLTPSDYGLLSILDLSMEVVLLLFSAGATAGLMRFYYKTDSDVERNQILFTAWAMAAGLYLAGTTLLFGIAPLVWEHVLSRAGSISMVRLAAANFALSSMMLVPMQMLSIDQRPIASSVATITKLTLQLSLNILFVVVLRLGPIGVLWSTFISALAVGVVMTVLLLHRTGVAWSTSAFRDLRRFSIPIQVSKAGTFFLTYGDRFFLEKFQGMAIVGLYGLAYQFGFLISGMLAYPFLLAWTPQRFQLARQDRAVRDGAYNRGFKYGNVIVVTGGVAISLYIRPLLHIMTTPEFFAGAAFVPVIVLAYIFQVWSKVVEFGIEFSEKTKYVSYATWCSVSVVAICYILLIPRFGGMGAAVATLAAMIVRFSATLTFSQRLWPVSYNWAPHVRMLAAGIVVTVGNLLSPSPGILGLLFGATAWLLVYLLWVGVVVLDHTERSTLMGLMRSPRSFSTLFSSS